MSEKISNLTLEKIREQNRERNKRYYKNHTEKVKKQNKERYHAKKKKLSKNMGDSE